MNMKMQQRKLNRLLPKLMSGEVRTNESLFGGNHG